MKRPFPIRLARPAALALLIGTVLVLGLGNTAWATDERQQPGRQGTVPSRTTDLAVRKSGVWAGDTIQYEVIVTNTGQIAAARVELGDLVLSPVTITSFTTSKGRCEIVKDSLRCALGTLAAKAEVTIKIETRVTRPLPPNVINTVVVHSRTPDPDYANNVASVVLWRP